MTRRQVPAAAGSTLSQPARELLLGMALVAGGAGVVVIWAIHAQTIRSAGDWLTAAGRVTGLEGTYAALVAVVLLARVPALDRAVGTDRLFAWHRWVGQGAVWLLSAHAVSIVWGYSFSFHQSIGSETRQVVLDLPDMLAATVALGLLVAIGLVSTRTLRRRLKYQTWYFLHLYVYLAFALSFAHQFATGTDFIGHPIERYTWIALYCVTLTLLVVYRVVRPLHLSRRHQFRVARVEPEGLGSTSIYLTGRDLDRWGAQAGQFGIWRFLDRSGWWQAHPFSFSAPPGSSELRLTVRSSGDFTRGLAEGLKPGTRVVAEGPFGGFTARRVTRPKLLLVAGGAGIAPIRALFETAPAGQGQPVLLYQAAGAEQMSLRAELDAVAAERGARTHYLVGRRDERHELFDATWLRATVGPDLEDHEVFICGPRGFMERVRSALRTAGVPAHRIHLERFEM